MRPFACLNCSSSRLMRSTCSGAPPASSPASPGMSAGGVICADWAGCRWKRSSCACAEPLIAAQATIAAIRRRTWGLITGRPLHRVEARRPYAPRLSVSSPPANQGSTRRRAVEYGHRAAVLRPAGDIVADRDRPLLAVTDRLHARGGNALRRQIIVRRLGALGAQREIVLPRAAFVRVAFDGE